MLFFFSPQPRRRHSVIGSTIFLSICLFCCCRLYTRTDFAPIIWCRGSVSRTTFPPSPLLRLLPSPPGTQFCIVSTLPSSRLKQGEYDIVPLAVSPVLSSRLAGSSLLLLSFSLGTFPIRDVDLPSSLSATSSSIRYDRPLFLFSPPCDIVATAPLRELFLALTAQLASLPPSTFTRNLFQLLFPWEKVIICLLFTFINR